MSEVNINYKGSTIASMDASGTKTLQTSGKYCEDDVEVVYTRPTPPVPSYQTKSVTPSESAQTVTADSGYDALEEVDVGAISSTYVGSGITRRSSTDLTASGATVSVPSGFYESNASKAVASGTAGTPTATKGTVSNHSVSVTPSVTNTTGYITGSTKTGTAVTVTASELVSGNKSITSNGTNIDVANYSTASVSVTPNLHTITLQSVSIQQTITPNAGTLLDVLDTNLTTPALPPYDFSKSVSLSITNGTTYAITGSWKITDTSGTTTRETGSISGNWVCGESLAPFFNRTSSYITALALSPTALSGTLTNRFTLYITLYIRAYGNYDGFSTITVNPAQGSCATATATTTTPSRSTSIAFTSLSGEPTAFFLTRGTSSYYTSNNSYYYIHDIIYDGTNITGHTIRSTAIYPNTSSGIYTFSYSSGSLTITSTGSRSSQAGEFYMGDYQLTYVYASS